LAAIAPQRMEHVAGQALRMDAHEHVLSSGNVALHERDVMLPRQLLAEGDRGEVAVRRRKLHRRHPLDELLVPPPILDEIRDGDELEPMTVAVRDEIRDAR